MKIKIALKKNEPGLVSTLIRWWTRSKYSHVEMIIPDHNENFKKGFWISSMPGKGVRKKPLEYPLDNEFWDYIDVDVPKENYQDVLILIEKIKKFKYATLDLFIVQLLGLEEMEDRKRMICSECVATLLREFKEPTIMKIKKECVEFTPEDFNKIYGEKNE